MKWLLDAYVRWRFPGWVAMLLCLQGCAGSFEEARSTPNLKTAQTTPERCESLDDQQAVAVLVAESFGFAAGGSGLGTIATDDDDLETALAIGAGASGAIAAGAAAFGSNRATAWARECAAR